MWKWYSGDESNPAGGGASDNQESTGTMSVADLTEQLGHTEQLVAQLKELIREKDNELRQKDQQLKEEKESAESKISKAKLQNKAKIASLSSQLEELKKQLASPSTQEKRSEHKKPSGDGDHENASANRGKILLLRRRVEELESQLALKNEDLLRKEEELEMQRLRGSEMDIMLIEKEKKLAEKEAYIIDLQISAGSNVPGEAAVCDENVKQVTQKESSNQELQTLIQNLTRKVGESEERCSLLQEQTESLKTLLNKEKDHFKEREAMYTENIRVFQNLVQEKEKELVEQSQKHEQELFKLAAKSDATADLHQLLKALKQKLHEEEEVLSGKNQVIDVLQKELDKKDQQFLEINEKCKRLQSEKENLQSKLDAEKHVMRAQLRDLMEKHETELRALTDRHSSSLQEIQEKHEVEIQEKCQLVHRLEKQLHDLGTAAENRAGSTEITDSAVIKLQDEVKLKTEEASKSEAKFLKMKAWSKSKIRQLEEELKISETKNRDLLKSRISELEQENRELEAKLEPLAELQSINEQLLTKLVIYEEQQRKLQADLEQVAKRANSQTSESGSVDELQNQFLEWNEMIPETEELQEQSRQETSVLALRMAQIEEEREAMDSGQQELEEELNAARGLGKQRQARRKGSKGAPKMQDDFDFARKSFEDRNSTLDSIDSVEGENMGGWWPEYGSPNSGLRTVVEELELERNQLQEQIVSLEQRCQELEDRLQLQVRIESLQVTFDVDEDAQPFIKNESERLQAQLIQVRQQQSRDAEKHHELVSVLNEQLKGSTDRNMFLENAIVEKEQIILESTRKVEHLGAIKKTLQEKEACARELTEKLDHTELQLEEATKKQIASEAECSALKFSNNDLTEKLSVFKEKVLKQDSALEKLQLDLEQTNEELDRLNTSHLEERSQLIHDLQRCEREVDIMKELLQEKDKEMSSLSASLTEYNEQVVILKEQLEFKDEQMRELSDALARSERESHLLRESQNADVQETSAKISSLSEELCEMDVQLNQAKYLHDSKTKEAEELIRQIDENGVTIKNLRLEIQSQSVTHNNHVAECSTQIKSLKEQISESVAKLDEMEVKYRKEIENLRSQLEKDSSEREKIAGLLEEKRNKEQSFENELKLAKEQYNKLVSGMSKKDEEMEQLSKELAEQKEICDKLNKELQAKEDHLSSSQQELQMRLQDKEEELKTLQENTNELKKQLTENSEMICKLNKDNAGLHEDNTMLKISLTEKDQIVADQILVTKESTKKVCDLEEKIEHLQREHDRLLEDLRSKVCDVSSLSLDLNNLQIKMTDTERLLMEKQNEMSQLMSDKESLQSKIDHISEQSLQKDCIVSVQLEERAKECFSLKKRLSEEQEISLNLHTQMRSLETLLQEAQKFTQEKDAALEAKTAEYNDICENLRQNQEKNTILQKQVEELTAAIERKKQVLEEKEQLMNTHYVELEQVKANFVTLQNEERSLREVNSRVTKQVEELNSALDSQRVNQERLQQEVGLKLEENVTLNKRLEVLHKDVEKLKREKEEAVLALSNIGGQCDTLQRQVLQSQLETDELKKQLDNLKAEKEKLLSDIELVNASLASKTEEIVVMSSHLSQQGHKMMSLKDQIDTLLVEKQTLLQSVEEKEALLSQKEILIQQAEEKLEGEDHYLQMISALQNKLQSSVLENTQIQEKFKVQELELRKLTQDLTLYKDKSEEAELVKVQLSEHMEVISDLHCQNSNLRGNVEELNIALAKKDEFLKGKGDDYVNLEALFSASQSSLDVQRKQIESLYNENEQYKILVAEKDASIQQSVFSFEELNLKLHAKEEQCEHLTQQVTDLEEIIRNRNNELKELKVFVKDNENSFLKKEACVSAQLEEKTMFVSELQNKVQDLTSKVHDFEQSFVDKENAVQNLQEKYAALHENKCVLEQSLSKKDEEIYHLVNSAIEKDECLKVAKSNVQALSNEVDLLREELERCTSNFKNVSDNLKEKDNDISQNLQLVQVIEAQLESLKADHQNAMTQIHTLTQEKEQRDLLVQTLQEKCSSLNHHIENLTSGVDQLNARLLQEQHNHTLQTEQFQLQVGFATQEKLRLEKELQALQSEKESSVATLQKQLTESTAIAKEFEEKLALHVKESEARICSDTNHLKSENADLQKQVSGQAEEISALKMNIEKLEHNLKELKQQSENDILRVTHNSSSLEKEIQLKESTIQTLFKDLYFVEEQLSMLCDETFTDYASFDQLSEYKSKLEKLSSLFSVVSKQKSDLAELKQRLEAKDRDIDQKAQLILSFENEQAHLQEEIQKVIDSNKLEKESLMEEIAAVKYTNNQQQCLLEEKENTLLEINTLVKVLQDEIHLSKDELQKSHQSLNEETYKMTEILEESKKKDLLIQNLNIQLSQQKELISTLSDQLKEKDLSIIQVMESMSNEMVKSSEEKNILNIELQNLQSTKESCLLEVSDLSEKLEACKVELQQSQSLLADKEMDLSSLVKEKDLMQLQMEKFSKEKENLKRKLQAALVIRKDLMQKIETIEISKQDEINNEQLKTAELRNIIKELHCKLERIQNQNEELQGQVQMLKQELLEKDVKVSEAISVLSEKEHMLEEFQAKTLVLQHSLTEKEDACLEYLRSMQEKDLHIAQIQNSMSEKIKTLEEENAHLLENVENLKSSLGKTQEKVEVNPLETQTFVSIYDHLRASSDEQGDSVLELEKAIVHNNVHASLLCSEVSTDTANKDKDATDLESLNSNFKELELLKAQHADLLVSYESKCKENEENKDQVNILQHQMQAQLQSLLERETQLNNKDLLLETQRVEIERISQELQKMETCENTITKLTYSVEEKDSQLQELNLENTKLLNEMQMLKDKMQELSGELESKLEEITSMKSELNQLDQYKVDIETMTVEISLLQKKVETSRIEVESSQLIVQQISHEKDTYFEAQKIKQTEIERLEHELGVASHALSEKDKQVLTLQDSLQLKTLESGEEIKILHNKLTETQDEACKLQRDFDQIKGEMDDCVTKLEKANAEISELRTKLKDSCKESETLAQKSSSKMVDKNDGDLTLSLLDTRPITETLQQADGHIMSVCNDCSRKENMIKDLECQILQKTRTIEELMENQAKRKSEEGSSKEQVQRKLQAALISRKEVLKENKMLKQNIEGLVLETEELKHSLAETHEKKRAETSLLCQENEELLSENKRLLSVNENLSAACESLKSTMETIVQEKEAFSFQLNSLKDSQTVELSGWKARHGELNKEYESLLQAYENISDEIDKMRQVIEITKREKHEVLQKFQGMQTENQEMKKEIQERNEETDELRTTLESKERELEHLQKEVDRLANLSLTVTGLQSHLNEMSEETNQLKEENNRLKETCENIMLSLENNEKERESLLISKTLLDNLQMDMDTYKSDMEIKFSELRSEKEVLSSKVAELTKELLDSKKSLEVSAVEKCDLTEALNNSELLLKEEKSALMKLESDLNNLYLEKMNLNEKVKILEDDKSVLLEEIENVQEQFCNVKNERENLESELLNTVQKNNQLADKFKSLQVQTNVLSQQVECLRAEKNSIMREKEEHQLNLLKELEQRVKCVQDDNRGTKSKSKELQELLKEKQQEINQLQRDSIQFQELILDLEGSVKESNTQKEGLEKQLSIATAELSRACKEAMSLNEELSNKKRLLESAKGEISHLTAELQQLRSKFPKLADELILEKQSDEMVRKGKVSQRVANGDKLSSSYEPGDKEDHNRAISEENVFIKSKHLHDLNTITDGSVSAVSRLQELKEPQSNVEALQMLKLENKPLKQETGNPKYVENQVKYLQGELAKKEEGFKQVMMEREKFRADFEKQVTISQHMKQIINNKDSEISVLISSKDSEISSYLEQIQSQYHNQVEDYEQQIIRLQAQKERSDEDYQKMENELKSLQAKYEEAINDKTQMSSKIEAFSKAMASLQSDRDLLYSELKDVHYQHESLLSQRDGIIGTSAIENNNLRHELRNVLNQVDDLNAENAMLGAQLVRYREDLNQVLSLKDHQLKELLRQKLDHIKNLEQDKCDIQKENREMNATNAFLKQTVDDLKLENQKLSSKVKDQEALIAAINKEKIVFESKKKKDLGSTMQDIKMNKLKELQNESDKNKDVEEQTLDFEHDNLGGQNGGMEERPKKTYWDIYQENKELKSQNESFGKAMAALQNNRDSLIEDFKELQWRYVSEIKSEKIRGDDLERQLSNFKSRLYSLLKKNSLLSKTLLASESTVTLDQIGAEVDSLCETLTSRGLEIANLSSECAVYAQQIDAFSKAMASLQHDREGLLEQLRVGTLFQEFRQGAASGSAPQDATESEYLTMNLSKPQSDKVTQMADSIRNSASEYSKLRKKVEELERLLREAKTTQEKAEQEITSFQCELAELRSEKNLLITQAQALHHQFNTSLADKDRQIAELQKTQKDPALVSDTLYGTQNLERVRLVASPGGTEQLKPPLGDSEKTQNEIQRYLQEIHQRDVLIQQINSKAVESVQMNAMLNAQLKTVSQGLKDSQIRYSDLQNQYYKLQRDVQSTRVTNRSDIQIEVPPGAPQERANVLVEIDNSELAELRRRLAETELQYDSIQQELSQLSERLSEERTRREAAEEALNLAEQESKRLQTISSSREYEFSLQMESDDEREALIIDPTQHFVVRKVRGGALSLRRWLRGRSLYCSKLLTSRSKSRYLFLTYLVMLHALVLMCLTGVL
ncbi:uncharacterized protein WCC33_009406 [Rhinophrynus dorsalis]